MAASEIQVTLKVDIKPWFWWAAMIINAPMHLFGAEKIYIPDWLIEHGIAYQFGDSK